METINYIPLHCACSKVNTIAFQKKKVNTIGLLILIYLLGQIKNLSKPSLARSPNMMRFSLMIRIALIRTLIFLYLYLQIRAEKQPYLSQLFRFRY